MIRALLLLLVAGTGCATTIQMASDDTRRHEADIARLGARLPARLWFHDLHGDEGRGVVVDGDSVSWVRGGELRTAALSEVRSVRFVDRRRGLWQGTRIGLATGVGAGVLLSGGKTGIFPAAQPAARRIGMSIGLLSAITTPVGALFGGLDGHQTVYRMPAAEPSDADAEAGAQVGEGAAE